MALQVRVSFVKQVDDGILNANVSLVCKLQWVQAAAHEGPAIPHQGEAKKIVNTLGTELSELMEQYDSDRKEGVLNGQVPRHRVVTLTNRQS